MSVAPWNHYQLGDQETARDLHLASSKNRLVHGCASFLCFGCAAAALESPSHLKVEPTHHHFHLPQDVLKASSDVENVKVKVCNSVLVDDDDDDIDNKNTCSPMKVEPIHHHSHHPQAVLKSSRDLEKVKQKVCKSDCVDDVDDNTRNMNACSLRSSLKRPARMVSVPMAVDNESEGENTHGNDANVVDYTRRRVQWTDVSGGELFVIWEFEPSEHSGSDDEFGNRYERSCLCKLM